MHDQIKFERMLKILLSLTGNRSYSLKELSENNHVSERTIRRYLLTFQDAGFIVEKQNDKYHIPNHNPEAKQLKDAILLTEEEFRILTEAIENDNKNILNKHLIINKLFALSQPKKKKTPQKHESV